MENRIPNSISPLRELAEDVALGADQYAASLPLVINTPAAIRGDITSLSDAATGYEQADSELSNRRQTVRLSAAAGRRWLLLAKGTFKPEFGETYNQRWDKTGLLGSTRMPEAYEEIQGLLRSFKDFLTANSDFEVAGLDITAAQAGTLLAALIAARGALHTQQAHVRNLKVDRDAKVKTLRARVRNTINEIASRISRTDPKWLAFGLNMPGAPTTPKAPLNVTADLIGPNAVSVKWDPSAYASYYRVWVKVVGVDQEFVNIGDNINTEFTILNSTPGAQLQIAVSASVTGGGESAKSEVVTVTMPN